MSYFNEPIEENPKYPCGICSQIIAINHKAIRCNVCNYKVHIRCNRIEEKDFKKIKNDEIILCIKCKEEIISFQRLANQQFHVTTKGINKDIEGINQTLTPSNNLKSFFKGINELNQPRSKNNDDDTPELNCNYVDTASFNYIKKRKNFS